MPKYVIVWRNHTEQHLGWKVVTSEEARQAETRWLSHLGCDWQVFEAREVARSS